MKEKSLILVDFTGKEIGSGKVIDTTSAQQAKEAQIFRENGIYSPLAVVVGNGDVILGIEEALKDMKEGEERTLILPPAKAFGERKKELIVLIPVAEFTKRKIRPVSGLIVDLNGTYGRVQTVSGGRVRVDLNNDLAGKDVEYKIRVVREVKESAEKVQIIAEKFFPLKQKVEAKIEAGKVVLKMPKEVGRQLAPVVPAYSKAIKDIVPEVKSVELEESDRKSEKSEAKKAETPN